MTEILPMQMSVKFPVRIGKRTGDIEFNVLIAPTAYLEDSFDQNEIDEFLEDSCDRAGFLIDCNSPAHIPSIIERAKHLVQLNFNDLFGYLGDGEFDGERIEVATVLDCCITLSGNKLPEVQYRSAAVLPGELEALEDDESEDESEDEFDYED